MVCKNCGSKLNDGDVFCWNCGFDLRNNQTSNNGNNVSNQAFNNNANIPLNSNYNNFNGMSNNGSNFNNVPPNNQNYQKKDSSKKNTGKIFILIFVVFLVLIMLYFIFTRDGNGQIKKNMSTMTLGAVSFKYDSTLWKTANVSSTTGNSNNMKSLKYSSYYVVLVYDTDYYFSSSYDFVNSLKSSYEKSGFTILNNAGSEKITLNGVEWYIIKYNDSGRTYYQLAYAKGYDSYSFTYMVDSSRFDSGFSYFEPIYKTLSYDTSIDLNRQSSAKNQLIGEWDWGKLGYFVVTQDKIYLYMDSSKSMNNVHYGTYTVSDTIPNVGYGKIDGLYVVANYTSSYVDGVSSPMATPEREYSFVKYSDGLYKINDLISGASGVATKVK